MDKVDAIIEDIIENSIDLYINALIYGWSQMGEI